MELGWRSDAGVIGLLYSCMLIHTMAGQIGAGAEGRGEGQRDGGEGNLKAV